MLNTQNFKVLFVTSSFCIVSKGYRIYTIDINNKCQFFSKLHDAKYLLLSSFSLLRRSFRAEITGLYTLKNGDRIAIAKKRLFLQQQERKSFEKCFAMPRGSKPLNLCITPSGKVFFGEYFQNIDKQEVNVYCSEDNARIWHIAYTFGAGQINHIHGLFHDPYTNRIWVVTGDRKSECIIGYTEDMFKSIVKVFCGGQEYRSCLLFFYPKFIVFATDSQYTQNRIKKFDRKTLEISELQDIQGSAIKGGQVGNVSFLSTAVEPSEVNKDRYAHLWVTKDGLHWEERYKAKKDRLPFIFQFGTFEFPQYEVDKIDRLYFSGRALKGLDGKTIYIDL